QEVISLRLDCCAQILNLLWNVGASEDDAAIVFNEGRELAHRTADVRSLALLNARYARIRLGQGTVEHLAYAREAERLADEVADLRLRLVVYGQLMRCLMFAGLISDALISGEALLQEIGDDRNLDVWDASFMHPATLASVGRWPEAAAWFQREIRRAREDQ